MATARRCYWWPLHSADWRHVTPAFTGRLLLANPSLATPNLKHALHALLEGLGGCLPVWSRQAAKGTHPTMYLNRQISSLINTAA